MSDKASSVGYLCSLHRVWSVASTRRPSLLRVTACSACLCLLFTLYPLLAYTVPHLLHGAWLEVLATKAWMGYPPCAMHNPQARSFNFSTDAHSVNAYTTLSHEFWATFPCTRSQYQVVLPSSPHAAMDAECGPTIVTAYFDIGREQWMNLARSSERYFQYMANVMTLRNRMVVFTAPDFVNRIVAMRASHGLMDRTIIIAMDLHCTPGAHLYEPTKQIMCKSEYSRGAQHALTPERLEPWYNILMWNKAYFLQAAALLPSPVASDYYIWLDAGCHDPMCMPSMAGTCVQPKPWARRDRVRIAQTILMSPEVAAMSPVEYYKRKYVHFAGTIFGTSAANVRHTAELFLDTLHWMNAQGAVEQDQAVFAFMFIRHPDDMDTYYINSEWTQVVQDF